MTILNARIVKNGKHMIEHVSSVAWNHVLSARKLPIILAGIYQGAIFVRTANRYIALNVVIH